LSHALRPLIGIPSSSQESTSDFTFYRYSASYTLALASAGGAPVAIPLGLPEDDLRAIFEHLDGLCLAGGVDVDPAHYGEDRHPDLGKVDASRDQTELLVTRWALAAGMPLCGICRGIQVLNVAADGSLYQHVPAQLRGADRHSYTRAEAPGAKKTHLLRVDPASGLSRIVGGDRLGVNSYHHQGIKRLGSGLRPVAWASDGLVEAVEGEGTRFLLGVQWHPEEMYASCVQARALFGSFVEACRQ
jgi:putative glutamine amidotransferase